MSTSVRGFSVAHQRVAVSIDVLERSLGGWTELTIVPTSLELKQIVLDARRLTIEKCYVNGIPSGFDHFDLLSNPPSAPSSWDAHQYALYGEKLKPLMKPSGDGPGELAITIPDSVKITEPNDATFIASHSTKEKTYEPLTLRIFYHINQDGPNEGLQFVNDDPKEAHVFTTHSPISQATSCWLPCVDGLWSLCTWELEFSVPQLLDEKDPDSEMIVACSSVSGNEDPDPTNSKRKIVKFGVFSPVSSQHVGFALGPFKQVKVAPSSTESTLSTEKAADSFDPSKNNNSTSGGLMGHESDKGPASGVPTGEAAANTTNGTSNINTGNDASLSGAKVATQRASDTNMLPITAFALPSKASLVSTSCKLLPRAMRYFTTDFGSFPYDSYSVVFVSDFPIQANTTVDACGLTICSDALLFTPDMIEPRFTECEVLVRGIAAQWSGVSIVPSKWNDIWVTEGIALYMTDLFIRKLMGNNEYRFRIRKGNDALCREDVDKPPIGDPRFRFPLRHEDLAFIRLKAPLILFILDRRMTKTDRSLGVSRVLTKLFLQSMSGDLRSQLSAAHFVRQCEKVAHHRLTKFFDDWVFGSGFPIFRITQRFNKKRLCIEMGIGQVHSREIPPEAMRDTTFLDRAITHLNIAGETEEGQLSAAEAENLRLMNEFAGADDAENVGNADRPSEPHFSPTPSFTGPMTIRIHEANGTPYEHVVELRDQLTKIDIPYNTKYKRLRRNQKFRKATSNGKDAAAAAAAAAGMPGPAGDNGDGLINCLGDVLMTDAEVSDWKFVDWGDAGDDEEGMFNEAFEWMRADADFEWLGQFFVSQPDYMYASQLQQDRDVVAQYDAVLFYGRQQPNPIYCTVLTRTLMDTRYYYGVRIAAAFQLAKLAVPQVNYAGMFLLLRVFRELYCFRNSRLPKANNFQDFAAYFVQKAILQALSRVRNRATGKCPDQVCALLLDLIRYNENSENAYSDTFYLANLLECVTTTLRPIDLETGEVHVRGAFNTFDSEQTRLFVMDVVNEIDKCQRLDRWVPSHHRIITTTAIKMEELLIMAGYGVPRMDKLLLETQKEETIDVRLAAISSILNLGGYRNPLVVEYLSQLLQSDPSRKLHTGILRAWYQLIGNVAINGEYAASEGSDPRRIRQHALARKSVRTAIPLLRETLGKVDCIKQAFWTAIVSRQTGSLDRRLLLEMCQVLYEPEAKLIVKMKTPKLYQLSMKRRRDFVIVAKFRSILKRRKTVASHSEQQEANGNSSNSSGTSTQPKLKLRLR